MNNNLNLLKQIIRSVPNYVFWKDKNLVYCGANINFAKSLGFDDINQLIGKKDTEIAATKAFAHEYQEEDRYILATGSSILGKEVRIRMPQKDRILSISKVPLYDESGNISGVLGIYIDITHIKENEIILAQAKKKAESANQAKTEFLENMRHDIRTPLTGIVGFSELLKSQVDIPLVKEYADNLISSSHALLSLLDEVLEAIRVSSGEIPKLKKKFSLRQTLNQVIDLNRARAAEKNIKLTLNVDDDLPHYIIGDKVRLHRITLELVANALNFTDNGFVAISVALAKRTTKKIIIKLIVEDSGMGIPKDKQQEIYVQFKRLTPSYQGIYKGAGLGLSVVKQFIDELSGEIYVESELKKGSRFICLIPFKEPLLDTPLGIDEDLDNTTDSPYEKTYSQEIKPVVELNRQHAFRVLVVEDNAIAQTVAKALLVQLRCETDLAENGKQALELWKNGRYDLIFMDIGLPDMDGYEVTHQIRLHELAQKTHSPIIALTAHAGDENKQRCIEAGMNAVLTKPLTAKSCTDILEAFLPGYLQQNKNNSSSQDASFRSELPQHDESLFDLTPYPVLDVEEGIKTTGTIETLAQMLHFMIHDSLLPDVQLMKKAHDAMDWDKTQQIAHKIKGGAVYVGTVKIKIACQYLERYWKSGQRELLEPLYQQTLKVVDETIQEINLWLSDK